MPMNRIQFQPGLSTHDFQSQYGSEVQCESAVFAARWPQGWRCAHCGCARSFKTRNGTGRQLWECVICGYQSSSIVGTVFEHTKLPLRVWFLALYLLTQSKNSISFLELMRQLGVSYKTAWLLKRRCGCVRSHATWMGVWRSMMRIWVVSGLAISMVGEAD